MKLTRFCCVAIVAIALTWGIVLSGQSHADVIGFDDFEGLNMHPFVLAAGTGDGTDWTDQIPGWTIDNSLQTGVTTELAYASWTAMDIDSWIDEQGSQVGRDTFVGAGTHNTVLVADPDAWDDYTTGADPNGYNSFIMKTYDLTGFDANTLSITMDYQFVTEDNQMGNIQVSFDGGSTWQTLASFNSTSVPNDTFFEGAAGVDFFNAGSDFNPTSNSMMLKIGCFESGNDWWFVVDNITIATTDGFSETEDFEGLNLVPFTVASIVGDGTDWSDEIPNWTNDSSGTVNTDGIHIYCKETAFDVWKAVDVFGWVNQQGVQAGRTLFNVVDSNNTVLLADGDAFDDFAYDINDNPPGDYSINSYVYRNYCLSGYDVNSIKITYLYEFAVENDQTGVAEVSFDGGATWTRLATYDTAGGTIANGTILAGQAEFNAGSDFTATPSGSMILRFGYIMAGNNWWFALDDVMVEADPAPSTALPCETIVVNGNHTGGTIADLATSDDSDFVVRRSNSSINGVVDLEFKGVSLNPNPSNFEFTLEGAGFFRFVVTQSIQLYDYDAGEFVEFDLRNASQQVDQTVVVNGTGNLGRFVEDGTGCVLARVLYTSSRPRQAFSVNIDKACWGF